MLLAVIIAALLQVQTPAATGGEAGLIQSSIKDFRAHPPGDIQRFRAVHIGKVRHPEGVKRPIICGEVQVVRPSGTREWLKFATLETRSGFEQWLGGSALTWCNSKQKLDQTRDLSSRFENELLRGSLASGANSVPE